MNRKNNRGFTLIELMLSVAVIAVLAAIAIMVYRNYSDRARGVEVIAKYDAIRSGFPRTPASIADDCAGLAKGFDEKNLANPYTNLSYAFEAVRDGYRPVLSVCSQVGQQGKQGVGTAREVHDTLAKNSVVEKGAVLTDSVVSFALRLTEGDQAYCKAWTARPSNPCATTVAQAPGQVTPPQPAVQNPPTQVPPVQTPPVQTPPGQTSGVQTPPAQSASKGGASASSGPPLLLPDGKVDAAVLAMRIEAFPSLQGLDVADKAAVVAVATQMAVNLRYAQMVEAAQRNAPAGQPALVPTSTTGTNRIRFYDDMNRALKAAYTEAMRQICVAKGPPICG